MVDYITRLIPLSKIICPLRCLQCLVIFFVIAAKNFLHKLPGWYCENYL